MFVLIALIGCTSLVSCAIESDRITDLPGLTSQPSFKQYSGYLTATGTRKLHYWCVNSQRFVWIIYIVIIQTIFID